MRKKFKILHIGTKSYDEAFANRNDVYYEFMSEVLTNNPAQMMEQLKPILKKVKAFDFIFIQTPCTAQMMEVLNEITTPYNTFIDPYYWKGYENEVLTHNMFIQPIDYENESHLLERIHTIAHVGQYGDKVLPSNILVDQQFDGDFYYAGNKYLILEGEFGEKFTPLATWKKNAFYESYRMVELWPEFKIEGNVEIEYIFRVFKNNQIEQLFDEFVVGMNDLKAPIRRKLLENDANISISLRAKGKGKLYLGAVHRRWSREAFGTFLMGGKRFSDSNRDEFIYHFHPGDLKPPLNVYFSGYRGAEGFEGYFLMKQFNAPFLLIGDPRIEGGGFYLGSEEYEQGIQDVIHNCLDHLGFEKNELILSGLSMGSFGALYYGAQLEPTAVIVGKPLVNVGTIAKNMKLLRPHEFGTANDIVLTNTGGETAEHIQNLNDKFWDVFVNADLQKTTFAISYMLNDDYDLYAFDDLLKVFTKQKVKTISRGITGRHNDDSVTINNWFIHFYNIMLARFGREVK